MPDKEFLLSLVSGQNLDENKEIEYTLSDDIDDYFFRSQTKRKPDGYIHPSSIGECPRYIFFWMQKIPYTDWRPHDAGLMRIFAMGKVWETEQKRIFRNMNILVATEVPIPKNRDRVKGKADSIVFWRGQYFILEQKTANAAQFTYRTPHLSYKYQLAAYEMYLKIPSGKLFYTNKDTCAEKIYKLFDDGNDPIFAEVKSLIASYNYNYVNRIVPDVTALDMDKKTKTPLGRKSVCNNKNCAYFTHCMQYPEQAVRI